MLIDRQSFMASFDSESLLIQAVAGLLSRMPPISGIQMLNGPNELGKDLIFFSRGSFGEPVLCACVVKNVKISGSVSGATGARTVLFQVEQSFDTPHVNENGVEVRVERVYVVTPYEISPTAVDSIRGKLRQNFSSVHFIAGARLFDLFKQYWPDYMLDEHNLLREHLKALREADAVEPLGRMAFQFQLGSIDKRLAQVYVRPGLYRVLNAYVEGQFISSRLPGPADLDQVHNHAGVTRWLGGLSEVSGVIEALAAWSYCSESDAEEIKQTIKQMSARVEDAIRRQKPDEKPTFDGNLVTIMATLVCSINGV